MGRAFGVARLLPLLDFKPQTAVLTAIGYAVAAAPVTLSGALGNGELLASVVLAVMLVLLTAIDIKTFRLPDILTLPLIVVGLLLAPFLQLAPELYVRCIAAFSAFSAIWLMGAAYEWWRGRQGIGLGDAKLFAAAGAWIGLEGLPFTLLLACLGGIAYAVLLIVRGAGLDRHEAIPFGPFLAGALWLVWLYGPMF